MYVNRYIGTRGDIPLECSTNEIIELSTIWSARSVRILRVYIQTIKWSLNPMFYVKARAFLVDSSAFEH